MARDCNCGPKKTLHQRVTVGGKTITYRDEDAARAAVDEEGGTYQAIQV